MSRNLFALAAAFTLSVTAYPTHASSPKAGGFFHGGLSIVNYEIEFSDGIDSGSAELDTGVGVHLAGGVHLYPGVLLRADFTTTNHDSVDFCLDGSGCMSFDDDTDLTDLRVGVFFQRQFGKVFGLRAGGGYAKFELETDGFDWKTDGLFLEVGFPLRLGRAATFDIKLAAYILEDNFGDDYVGAEFGFGPMFNAGPVNIGLSYRVRVMSADYSGSDEEDHTYSDFRLTVGGTWGYRGR